MIGKHELRTVIQSNNWEIYLKPVCTSGKMSVNASILYKNEEVGQ